MVEPSSGSCRGTTDHPINVLFLCHSNAGCSTFAEAILNDRSKGRFLAYGATWGLASPIHGKSLSLLRKLGHDIPAYASKPWSAFLSPNAPKFDCVITVSDAQPDILEFFSHNPIAAHWVMADPAKASRAQFEAALRDAYATLSVRIELLMALPFDSCDRSKITAWLSEIGRLDLSQDSGTARE